MTGFDILDRISELKDKGRPFCVATVVRTADVTSAKAGAKAAITEAGEIIGHLGGACVNRAIKTAAAEALKTGAPAMIRVKPSDKVVSMQDTDGVQLFKSGCPSGGTVDLLIEVYTPAPRLVIFGQSPIARALAAHAALMGFRIACDAEVAPDNLPHETLDRASLDELNLGHEDFIVIASQGQNDRDALRAAVESPVRHVTMVASGKKAQALSDRLIKQGVEPELLSRVKSPAGLDLGGIDPHEIAISVLAEIIVWRNASRVAPPWSKQGIG